MYNSDDFENVSCYYTGGGIWVYSAKYKGFYLYGSLDQYMGCYTISGETIESECGCDYEKYTARPSVYPTWGDIAKSLVDNLSGDPCLADMLAALAYYNPDLNQRVCDDE